MSFRITGLSGSHFQHLYGLDEAELSARGIKRVVADKSPGFPDRVELRDAKVGERLLLLNYEHQPAQSPYRASHAIFVLEGASETYDRSDEVPDVLRRRLLSLRAFDTAGMMVDADVTEGKDIERLIARFFANPEVSYIHAHNARQGCYAARIDRVQV